MVDSVTHFFIDSPAPLIMASVLYLLQTAAYLRHGEVGLALAFGSYAVANVGFVIDILRRHW